MKWLAIAVVVAVLLVLGMARKENSGKPEVPPPPAGAAVADKTKPVETKPMADPTTKLVIAAGRPMTLTPAEKAARVEKICSDYNAIRKGVADELAAVAAASASGPGPFGETNVFLRRLALLEREQRTDLAQVLDAQELEDFELRESSTGQLVAMRLGATVATEAQRRAVFRLRREFDERFGFEFDLSRNALVERDRVRKEMDARIRVVLGEDLFAVWTAGDLR